MPSSTTMTIRVSPEVKEKLDRLASGTQRSRSFLAAEAVASYVDRELEIVAGIHRGLDDMEMGHVVPHDEAMAEIDAVIEVAKAKRTRKT